MSASCTTAWCHTQFKTSPAQGRRHSVFTECMNENVPIIRAGVLFHLLNKHVALLSM